MSSRLVILPFIITLRLWFSALSNSRTGEKAANFLRIYPIYLILCSRVKPALRGTWGVRENFLYQKTLTGSRIKFSSTHVKRNLPEEKKKKSVLFVSVIGRYYCTNKMYN